MLKWLEPPDIHASAALQQAVGGSPLIADTLARRGFTQPPEALAFLHPERYQPTPSEELPGMQAAVARLQQALHRQERIWVWGDFDVDGQTATAMLVTMLRELGADVRYHIPVRAAESHGVNLPWLEKILQQGADLLLTCDTGITAFEAVEYARQHGLDVIITDHHDLATSAVDPSGGGHRDAPMLPQACAVVNPKLLPAGHPLATLPGAGVAYKLAEAMYTRAGNPQACQALLDLVALGIVADLAIQQGEARYLLQLGLQALRQNRRLGLSTLLEIADVNPQLLTEEHISFVIAPRMNALGRLGDANPMVELLTTQDAGQTRSLAYELESLNAYRKLISDQIFQGAQAQILTNPALLDSSVLVLAHPQWEAGVLGLVASRLVESYHRPVILLKAPPGEAARGSARSIDGVHITEAIARHQHLLAGFGGHPMAAGLSIQPENIPEFRRAINHTVQEMLGGAVQEGTLQIDGYLNLSDLSLELVADLERLAPFGPGNPPLALALRNLQITSHSAVGKNQEHLLLTVHDQSGNAQRVIWWQGAGWSLPEGAFDLAVSLRTTSYKGQRELQVVWLDARPLPSAPETTQPAPYQPEILDLRQELHPEQALLRLRQRFPSLQVWSEAGGAGAIHGLTRLELIAGEPLAIWTPPAGPEVLRQTLDRLRPEQVFLFNSNPGMDEPTAFLERLAGLVKRAISVYDGMVEMKALCAATAQRTAAVQVGLEWLQARGYLYIVAQQDDRVQLQPADRLRPQEQPTVLAQASVRLKALLEESAAYRRHYAAAPSKSLVRL
jgi:single-stranded-DNA-specific exonuclease